MKVLMWKPSVIFELGLAFQKNPHVIDLLRGPDNEVNIGQGI